MTTLVSALALTGCVSVHKTGSESFGPLTIAGTVEKPHEHVVVSNFGYYLFDIFPIICGDTDRDAKIPVSFFHDKVRLENVQSVMLREVKNTDCDLVNYTTSAHSDPCFSISMDPKCLLGLLFCYREVQQSAILIKREKNKPLIDLGGNK